MYAINLKKVFRIWSLLLILSAGGCAPYQFGTHTDSGYNSYCISQNSIRVTVRKEEIQYQKSFMHSLMGELSPSQTVKNEYFEFRYALKDIDKSPQAVPFFATKLFELGRYPSDASILNYKYPDYIYPAGDSELSVYLAPERKHLSPGNSLILTYNIIDVKGRLIKSFVSYGFAEFSNDYSTAYYFGSNKVYRMNISEGMKETVLSDSAYELLKDRRLQHRPTREDNIFLEAEDFAHDGGVYRLVDIQNGAVLKTFSVSKGEYLYDVAFENGGTCILLKSPKFPNYHYIIRNDKGEPVHRFSYDGSRYGNVGRAWNPKNKIFCIFTFNSEGSWTKRSQSKVWYEGILWDYGKNTKTEFRLDVPSL